ncbi:hypothetical protein [Achromobacter xylosoxidans]|nr:hypothetical protein [Achromobacter xylosoxidans]
MDLYVEWKALLESRRRHNTSGQDGRDFEQLKKPRGIKEVPQQLELFA